MQSTALNTRSGKCFAINGFEYQIREVSRCVAEGRTASSLYPPEDSIALTALMEQIRTGWGMKFAGEL